MDPPPAAKKSRAASLLPRAVGGGALKRGGPMVPRAAKPKRAAAPPAKPKPRALGQRGSTDAGASGGASEADAAAGEPLSNAQIRKLMFS